MTTAMEKSRAKKGYEELATLSFDDLLKQLEADDAVVDASDLGDGFKLIASGDKKKLVGVPMVVLDYRPVESKRFPGAEYWTVAVKLATGEAIRFNDGSTGVAAQLEDLWHKNGQKAVPIRVRHGLRASEYEVVDEDKKPVLDPNTKQPIRATTFYLDTSL